MGLESSELYTETAYVSETPSSSNYTGRLFVTLSNSPVSDAILKLDGYGFQPPAGTFYDVY